ncbi:MAG: type II toxin-antitoxin system HicB family antitoxin [Patescibacteria group bacterium]
MKNASLRYQVIFRPEPEGGYTAIVPALPGCVTFGKNLRETRTMAEDAIAGYLVSLRKHNEPIPSDTDSFMTVVDVSHSSSSLRA